MYATGDARSLRYQYDSQRTTLSSTLRSTHLGGPGGNPYARVDQRPLTYHAPLTDEKWSWQAARVSSRLSALVARARSALQSLLPASLPLPLSTTRRRNLRLSTPSLMTPALSVPPLQLPDPATVRFVLLCALWYTSSALSSNTGKAILTQFKYPVTLTFVQFGFVASYCLLFMSPVVRFTRLRSPTRAILKDALPMGLFQVGGHIFSSMAISRIHVSTVHTIKALSPLFTVAAYALLFGVRYSAKTYISLLPLTFGVMLACSFDVSASNNVGVLCAFGSALVFVSSNIFFKKIMPTSPNGTPHHAPKLDKLNLLFYSSGMAFLLMIPIWVTTDLPVFLAASADPAHVAHPSHSREATHSVPTYLLANGTVHFAQNIIAFIILASVSPVTYSIASLIKRVAVICIAIVWFAQRVHPVQGCGIGLTFFGLWLYHGAKGDVERGEKERRGVEARREGALPLTREEEKEMALAAARHAPEQMPAAAELHMNFGPAIPHPPNGFAAYSVPPADTYPFSKQTHRAAGLVIDLPLKGAKGERDPYPSPPASIDSPPLPVQLVPVLA